jgi:hypothetical protein
LHQFECFRIQVFEATLNKAGQVLAVVAVGGVRIQTAACFGDDVKFIVRPFSFQLRQQPFAAPVAIDVGGIEEIDALIQGFMKGGDGLFPLDMTPISPDRPTAESNRGNAPACSSECSIFHIALLSKN